MTESWGVNVLQFPRKALQYLVAGLLTLRRMTDGKRTENTQKINSPELQKNFHAVYKNFFNSHDLVLSGDAVLTWGTDISHGISALRIKQKLPIKTFC